MKNKVFSILLVLLSFLAINSFAAPASQWSDNAILWSVLKSKTVSNNADTLMVYETNASGQTVTIGSVTAGYNHIGSVKVDSVATGYNHIGSVKVDSVGYYESADTLTTTGDVYATVATIDFRSFKYGIILLKATTDTLDYKILGYANYSGNLSFDIVSEVATYNTVVEIPIDPAANDYSKIIIQAKPNASGENGTLTTEYILKP